MNRPSIVRSLLAGIALVLCLGLMTPAHAAVVSDVTIPLELPIFVPCVGETGEFVLFTGERRIKVTQTVSQSGNEHFDISIYDDGAGIDSLGTVYHLKGKTQTLSNVTGVELATQIFTFNNILRAITPGPAANFTLHELIHTTFNANGIPTSFVSQFSSECQG